MEKKTHIIRFIQGQSECEIASGLFQLKKEKSEEVLYTSCGIRIPLNDLLSMNGIAW